MMDTPSPETGPDARAGLDWGALLAAHADWLRKVILARTGEPQAVDEVVQQVALAALEQRSPLVDRDRAVPWLHRLAVIQSARYRRKLGRERNALRKLSGKRPHLGNAYAQSALAWLVTRERHSCPTARPPGRASGNTMFW